MPQKHLHCELDHVLASEEILRLKELFRQQGIQINDSSSIAKIKKLSRVEFCEFRYNLGTNFQFCANDCVIKKMLK